MHEIIQYQNQIYYLTENLVMFNSKEDQLLAKLQKCVGKLSNEGNAPSQLDQRLSQRYSYGEASQKYPKPGYNKYSSYDIGQQSGLNTSYQIPRRATQRIQDKQNNCDTSFRQPSNVRKSISKDYLTQRSFQYPKQPTKQIQNYTSNRPETQQTKRKYDIKKPIQIDDCPINSTKTNYNMQYDKPRRPLRQYEMNKQNSAVKPTFEKRQTKPYIYQQKQSIKQNPSNQTPKYDRYKNSEQSAIKKSTPFMADNFNRSAYKESLSSAKRLQVSKNISEKYDKYDYKAAQIPRPNRINNQTQNKSNRSERIQQLYSNAAIERSRQLSSQQKLRTGTAGSISSISRKISQEQNKKSYETFDQKQTKQLNLKQILDSVGNTHQDTFTKLQKISQLNQRINLRIKNIIDTFESK